MAIQVLVPLPEKDSDCDTIRAFFSYIRLRRVILLRSYICCASYIALRAVLEANIISLPQSGNITFAQQKYHSGKAGISLKRLCGR